MPNAPLRPATLLSLLLLAGLGSTMAGCPSENAKPAVDEQEIRSELEQDIWRTAEYTVRGQVVSLPDADNDLMVHHEAIPEYRSPKGMGMDVMTMPFPLGDGISLEGIEPNDKVMITFSVDYQEGWSPIAYCVIAIEELPAETELDFTPLQGDGE